MPQVPDEPQPSGIIRAIRIGPRLRAARLKRGLSIAQVAESTGLTKGFLSQLERDLTSASVASLVAICDAIGLRIGSLFEPPRSDLVRRADRQRIDVGGIGVTDYLLSAESDSRIQVLESHIEPGGGGGGEPRSVNSAAEFVHVVAGELEVRMHNRAYRLYSGDSLTFSPRDVHTWRNPSEDDTAVVFWVLMPSPW